MLCLAFAFGALTLLVGWQEGYPPVKNGGWWRWALVSPDGVAHSQMDSVSASVILPLHQKAQKFSSGTSSPRWSRKKGCKTVLVCYILPPPIVFIATCLFVYHRFGEKADYGLEKSWLNVGSDLACHWV